MTIKVKGKLFSFTLTPVTFQQLVDEEEKARMLQSPSSKIIIQGDMEDRLCSKTRH